MTEMRVKVTFVDELLGTAPNNKEIYTDYIASKAPDATNLEDEVAAVGTEAVIEKGMTVFPRTEDGVPFLYDYQWRGYFKETCSFLRKVKGTASEKIKAFKKQIDGLIFIKERETILNTNGKELGVCQRPLRASTPQGERVSISCSETCPEGTTCEFTVICMVDSDTALIREWLDYGALHGTGQWRNSGKGRFVWDELDEDGNVIGGNNEFAKSKKSKKSA